MRYIADLHIHSKYSRATSRDLNLENIEKWCRIKGINICGTGDFTHPLWLGEIKKKLVEAENGLLKLRSAEKLPRFPSNRLRVNSAQGGLARNDNG